MILSTTNTLSYFCIFTGSLKITNHKFKLLQIEQQSLVVNPKLHFSYRIFTKLESARDKTQRERGGSGPVTGTEPKVFFHSQATMDNIILRYKSNDALVAMNGSGMSIDEHLSRGMTKRCRLAS
jgi:hypothetical protein